jgi:hypothetical protein
MGHSLGVRVCGLWYAVCTLFLLFFVVRCLWFVVFFYSFCGMRYVVVCCLWFVVCSL